MSWHSLTRDGAALHGFDGGQGPAVVFQHGLGGDGAQVAEVFPADGFRRLTLECRAQGKSGAGSGPNSIAVFADDVIAFADARGVERFAAGGISMGAAIALRLAVTRPERVSALILARPAWLWGRAPDNMRVFAELAGYLARGAQAEFAASATAQKLAVDAPGNLASLSSFFNRPNTAALAQVFTDISGDGPGVSEDAILALKMPVLVLGTAVDFVHPLAYARQLAALIPGARFAELTPKSTDKMRHAAEFRAAAGGFLQQPGD